MTAAKLTTADLRLLAEWLVKDYDRAEAAGQVRREPQRRSLVRYFDTPGYLSSQQTRERDNAIASRSFTKDCAR